MVLPDYSGITSLFSSEIGRVKSPFAWLIVWLNLVFVALSLASSESDSDETDANSDPIVNERIPLKPKALEKHWQINCKLAHDRALVYLQGQSYLTESQQQLSDDLKRCGYIYNMMGSAHYQAEPNYLLLHKKIEKLHR